jgi:hypothetical protein
LVSLPLCRRDLRASPPSLGTSACTFGEAATHCTRLLSRVASPGRSLCLRGSGERCPFGAPRWPRGDSPAWGPQPGHGSAESPTWSRRRRARSRRRRPRAACRFCRGTSAGAAEVAEVAQDAGAAGGTLRLADRAAMGDQRDVEVVADLGGTSGPRTWWARSAVAPAGIQPSRAVMRWTWVSIGKAARPIEKRPARTRPFWDRPRAARSGTPRPPGRRAARGGRGRCGPRAPRWWPGSAGCAPPSGRRCRRRGWRRRPRGAARPRPPPRSGSVASDSRTPGPS